MCPVNAAELNGRLSTCSLVRPHRSQHPVPQVIFGPIKMSALWCETNESVLTQDTGAKSSLAQTTLPTQMTPSAGFQQFFKFC